MKINTEKTWHTGELGMVKSGTFSFTTIYTKNYVSCDPAFCECGKWARVHSTKRDSSFFTNWRASAQCGLLHMGQRSKYWREHGSPRRKCFATKLARPCKAEGRREEETDTGFVNQLVSLLSRMVSKIGLVVKHNNSRSLLLSTDNSQTVLQAHHKEG